MAARAYFLAVFAPEGWPSSVAPEYGRYQLWDTIQQARGLAMTQQHFGLDGSFFEVTFFVNTASRRGATQSNLLDFLQPR